MKMNHQKDKTLTLLGSIFLLGSSLFVCLCFFFVAFKGLSSKSAVELLPQIPIINSISLPSTIEDVRSTCSNGECIQACVAHVNNVIQQEHFDFPPSYKGDDVDLVYYAISKTDELDKPRKFDVTGDLLSLRDNTKAHELIWSYFSGLFPIETRPNLVMFGIYTSSTSDGKFDTTLTEKWIMKINILSLEDSYYVSSALIHEYGHYLTLNPTQMDGRKDEWGNCLEDSYYGCQPADAYLNLFYWKFWDDIYPEWSDIDYGSKNYDAEINSFYLKYKDRFLNDYAATDPLEDIAESWTAFILNPTPTGDKISEQKVNFFYDFPELVELRYQIIKGICTFESPN